MMRIRKVIPETYHGVDVAMADAIPVTKKQLWTSLITII